jgi:DNA-binding NtrC family response regulator
LADIIGDFEAVCAEFGLLEAVQNILPYTEKVALQPLTFITNSTALNNAMESIYAANREERNIIIYGEPGAGKRLLAVVLHRRPDNPRHSKPLLSYYCSTMDSETLETELFGTKGGFLGLEKHKAALEMADGGTILLKDVDSIPLTLQDRLAEIFCKDEYYKIGETRPVFFTVRFLLTSKLDIVAEAKEGRFSERLLRVLNPASIYIPPLRERRKDIELIAEHIINKYNLQLDDPALLLGLSEYYEKDPFPGNLKSLKRLLFFLSAKHRLKS